MVGVCNVYMDLDKFHRAFIYTWFSTIAAILQFKIPSFALMKAALKYLVGIAGPSGFGSKSTADQVTQHSSINSQLTAIITGTYSLSFPCLVCLCS